jgi:methyl-accepting chemotaxis protein/methyl-accepting chemotaxis protein-1 (serine sensor receptor)
MKRNGPTLGTKLLGVFACMLALIVTPLGAYLESGRQAHGQLREILDRYNKKMDIGTQVELATTEMQGAQRGVMLSYAMDDRDASEQYKTLYDSSGKKIDDLMAELRPLLANGPEESATAEIQDNRATWAPKFRQLVELCVAGKTADAYKLRNENKLISAKMRAAAAELVKQQKKALEEARLASEAAVSRSNWVALLITFLCIAVSATMLAVVRGEIAKLRCAVKDLEGGASEVANASHQVVSASQSVAQGASEQAASVEETTGSVEQITAVTRQNADQLRAANDLTEHTGEAIEEANRALSEMQSSMQEINTSCEKVGKIIRVIDEIAFQTNILALNAAVESARAGEAGLSFAVVADEVRNLAQRSAKAAGETAELIEESIAKSKEGRANLENVSGAIAKVTGSARQIGSLVNGVKTEQTRGIEQIATAMERIERVTQSSAAAAEATATVGAKMSAQANILGSIVQRLHAMVG